MNKIDELSHQLQTLDPQQDSQVARLCRIINDLIQHDLNLLVQFLYQVDISEDKLKKLLRDHPETDAAVVITELLVERQLEKMKTRTSFRKDEDISDEERW